MYGALDAASNHIGGIGLGTSIKQPQDIYRYLGVFPVPNDEQISKLGAIHVLMGSQLAQGKVAYTTVLNMLNNISDEDLIDNRRVLELLKTIIIFLEDAKTSFKNALESGKDFTKMVP